MDLSSNDSVEVHKNALGSSCDNILKSGCLPEPAFPVSAQAGRGHSGGRLKPALSFPVNGFLRELLQTHEYVCSQEKRKLLTALIVPVEAFGLES